MGLQSGELRHYDPSVGRWMNDEPIGHQPDGDLYRYPAGIRDSHLFSYFRAGTITSNVLDAAGLVTSTWVGTDDGTPPAYNGGNMVDVTDYTYDPDGDVLSMTQHVGGGAPDRTTTYGYDSRDRLLSTMTFDGTYYTYTFNTCDNLGNVIETQDYQAASPWTVNPAGDTLLSQSSTSYDGLGEAYQTSSFVEDTTQSPPVWTAQTTNDWYDADGNEVKLTDPDGNTTTWQYDGLGQMTSETNAAQTNAVGENDQYVYDAAGEVTEKIDADGRAITYSYDGIGRETAENWYASVDGSGNPVDSPTETMSYTYNPAGLVCTASDANATYTYAYDAAGEVTSETQQLAGLAPTIVFQEQYTAGNRTQLAAAIGGTDDFVNNYQYNSVLGQMSLVGQTGNGGNAVADKTATFTYNNLGQFVSSDRYADYNADPTQLTNLVAQVAYGYDSAGQLTSIAYSDGQATPATLDNFNWTYDALGNVKTSSSSLDGAGGTVTYSSDSTGQLLGASGGQAPTESYQYDANGNRETVTTSGNQVTCITGPNNELLYDGTYTYSYDGEGNQTARWVQAPANSGQTAPAAGDSDITTYTWDNRDRLTSVTHYQNYGDSADLTVTYVYDAFNRWIGETVTSGGTTTQTRYVYDGNQIVMQFQGTGSGPLAANNLSDRYLWGPAVDQLLSDEQLTPVVGGGYDLTSPGTTVWTLTDNENTVRDLATYNPTTQTTAVVNHREFSAYGDLLSQTNPQTGTVAAVDCFFAYTGRALSRFSENTTTGGVTGIQNNGGRWYDAITGRWLRPDPSGLGPDVNPYRYCDNGPTSAIDPTGLQTPGGAKKPKPVGAPAPFPGEPTNNPQPGPGNQPQQNGLFPLQIGESGGNYYIRCSGNSDTGTLTVQAGVGQPPQGTGPATSGAPPIIGVQQNTINGTTTIVGGIPVGTGGIGAGDREERRY